MRVDHLESEQVRDLVQRIDRDHGRLDVLVNDIWGGDTYLQFNTTLWEHDLAGGLRMLRLGIDTMRSPATTPCRCSSAAPAVS